MARDIVRPDPYARYDAAVLRLGGSPERVELMNCGAWRPQLQPLADGATLIVGPRTVGDRDGTGVNAWIYDSNGSLQKQFALGDGIEHVQTTPTGQIWVGYFDEGIHGPSRELPIGASGLVRWNLDGAKEWEYSPPPGLSEILDDPALNVVDEATWALYENLVSDDTEEEEPVLVRIDQAGRVIHWRASGLWLLFIRAFAVDERQAWFVRAAPNPYAPAQFRREDNPRVTCLDFGEGRLEYRRDLDLFGPDGTPLAEDYVTGRGSTLHLFSGSDWFSLDVSSV